jgi:excisionase family DNA binding protein
MEDKKFYTVQEVADLFRVTTITVYQWIAKGKLPAIKVFNRVRIRVEEVERLMK